MVARLAWRKKYCYQNRIEATYAVATKINPIRAEFLVV